MYNAHKIAALIATYKCREEQSNVESDCHPYDVPNDKHEQAKRKH